MTTPQQMTVPESVIERATQLAGAMTADPEATGSGDGEWTVQEVIDAALRRGLAELERAYGGRS